MKLSTVVVACIASLAVAGTSYAVVAATTSDAASTGGYPWASTPCQSQTWTGVLTNGQTGTVCPDDNWGPPASAVNPQSSYDYRNCTDYVAWKVEQTDHVMVPRNMGNASNWGTYFRGKGNPPTSIPIVGAIAWVPGGDHVAFVEAVSSDGQSVTVSEYNEQYRPGYISWGTGVYDEQTRPTSHFQYIHVGSATPAATTPPPHPTTTPTTPAPSAKGFVAQNTWQWTEASGNGYQFATTFSTAAISTLNAAPLLSGFTSRDEIASACQVDPAATGVIPVRIKLTNATPNFPASIREDLYLNYTDDDFYDSLQVATVDSDGTVNCSNIASWENQSLNGGGEGGPWELVSPGQLQGGASAPYLYAYFTIAGYFSPDFPNGDPETLSSAILALFNANLTSFSGPGYTQGGNGRGYIALNGQPLTQQQIGFGS
jgi:surface antigen